MILNDFNDNNAIGYTLCENCIDRVIRVLYCMCVYVVKWIEEEMNNKYTIIIIVEDLSSGKTNMNIKEEYYFRIVIRRIY